jgi:hypothetical protein
VAYVENNVVAWAIENAVDSHGKLHGAEVGGKMAAVFAHTENELLAYFARKLGHSLCRQSLQLLRRIYFSKILIFFRSFHTKSLSNVI